MLSSPPQLRWRTWRSPLLLLLTILTASACQGSSAGLAASQAAPSGQPAPAGRSTSNELTAPPGTINRIELSQETVELNGLPYSLQIAELVFGPHAETPLHTHPGPSSGYMLSGRITVTVPGENRTNTYAGDSAIAHPWNKPHRFSNPTDDSVRMLSFELTPLTP